MGGSNEDGKPRRGRKLLVAAVGVATLTFAGCDMGSTSGNLIAPPPCDDAGHYDCTDAGPDSGPPPAVDAGPPDAASGTDEDSGAGT